MVTMPKKWPQDLIPEAASIAGRLNFALLPRVLVRSRKSYVFDSGNLTCSQFIGTTSKNPNIEIRIFKIINKNIIIRSFPVLVIDIFVICICLEFRYSNLGFPRL